MHHSLSHFPTPLLDVLETSVQKKFNAYFEFTGSLKRSVPDPHNPWFIYPEPSLVSDLLVLAALFGETYQAFDDHAPNKRADLATIFRSEPNLREDYRRIVEGESAKDPNGSFWMFTGPGQVSTNDAVTTYMEDLLPTIRNGFLHFHWRFENQSAMEYWKAHHWSTYGADPRFNLPGRPEKNYSAYIADGSGWDPGKFWTLKNLRILVTPYHILRYHLHLSLQQLLNNKRVDVFGNQL